MYQAELQGIHEIKQLFVINTDIFHLNSRAMSVSWTVQSFIVLLKLFKPQWVAGLLMNLLYSEKMSHSFFGTKREQLVDL